MTHATFVLAWTLTVLQAGSDCPSEASQLAVSRTLSTGRPAQQLAAIAAIRQITPSCRSVGVITATIAEVNRRDGVLTVRRRQAARGVPLRPMADDGYLESLLSVLTESSDRRVIRPLTRFASTGSMVGDALARFGEQAVPELITAANDPTVEWVETSGALRTLAATLTSQTPFRVSDRSRAAMVVVARNRITHPQPHQVIVAAAAELGYALQDTLVIRRARTLSGSVDAIHSLGIVDPTSVRLLQSRLLELEGRGVR